MKKIVGLLVAGVLAAGALVAAPALVPATSSAGGTVASTALSLVSPDVAEAKKKKHKKLSKKAKAKKKAAAKKKAKKALAKKSKATKSEYKKIKRGMTLAKVRKIIGSKGKRSWYYESTSSNTQCDDGYYTGGYYEPVETWVEGTYDYVYVDGHYDDYGNWVDGTYDYVWVDGYYTYEDVWVEEEWVDGECWDEDLTTVYSDYYWKNNKGGSVYVSFEDGKVTYKSWYN